MDVTRQTTDAVLATRRHKSSERDRARDKETKQSKEDALCEATGLWSTRMHFLLSTKVPKSFGCSLQFLAVEEVRVLRGRYGGASGICGMRIASGPMRDRPEPGTVADQHSDVDKNKNKEGAGTRQSLRPVRRPVPSPARARAARATYSFLTKSFKSPLEASSVMISNIFLRMARTWPVWA